MSKKSTNRKAAIREYMRRHDVKHTVAARAVDALSPKPPTTPVMACIGQGKGLAVKTSYVEALPVKRVVIDPWGDLLGYYQHQADQGLKRIDLSGAGGSAPLDPLAFDAGKVGNGPDEWSSQKD